MDIGLPEYGDRGSHQSREREEGNLIGASLPHPVRTERVTGYVRGHRNLKTNMVACSL